LTAIVVVDAHVDNVSGIAFPMSYLQRKAKSQLLIQPWQYQDEMVKVMTSPVLIVTEMGILPISVQNQIVGKRRLPLHSFL
jgi:hypothetical protein